MYIACLAQLSGDPPFLKDAWLKKYLTPKTTARFRGPGYRLPPHWDTTAFPTVSHMINHAFSLGGRNMFTDLPSDPQFGKQDCLAISWD